MFLEIGSGERVIIPAVGFRADKLVAEDVNE